MNYVIKYFKKSDSLCADDFENNDKIEWINLDFLLSLSSLKMYYTPMSGKEIGRYALVTMSNNDKYCIREDEFIELEKSIAKN